VSPSVGMEVVAKREKKSQLPPGNELRLPSPWLNCYTKLP